MIQLEIPYGISLDGLKEVIAGLHRAQAHRQGVDVESITKTVKFKPKTIQRQIRFLEQIGVLKGKHLEFGGVIYSLTEKGAVLARALDYAQDEIFRESMRDFIVFWKEIKPLTEFLSEVPEVNKEKLIGRILMNSNRPSNDKNAKMGIVCLVNLLEEIGFIIIKDDKVQIAKEFRIRDSETIDSQRDNDINLAQNETEGIESIDLLSGAAVLFGNIHIKNIRSIANTEIPLKKLNIFIGKNASGKSSIVHSLLALRNLQWERTFANSSYREMEWLRRRGTKEPMVVSLKGKVTTQEISSDVNLTIAFTPSLSFCAQLCILQNDRWVCDTSFFSETGDLLVPFDMFKGFKDIQEKTDKLREGFLALNELFKKAVDVDRDQKESSGSNKSATPRMFSIMMNDKGDYVESYSSRRLLGAWPELLPEFLRDSSSDSLREAYLISRPALRYTIDSIEFIPVIRGFLSLQCSQEDAPSPRLSDDIDFAAQLLNKLILPDEVDKEVSDRMKRWAKEYGIEGFETVLQKGRKIEARGKIGNARTKLPVALYGFGSNQFLSLVGKCSFSLDKAPIIIEEPEIHLHPELQARTMDFLIEMMNEGHQLFVTTHSEHLIGRLQLRIAEKKLQSKDVAVIWVRHENEEDGTKAEEVKMDTKGIFHEGLVTYLGFLEEELKRTQQARQTQKG